jgi:DNA polymerase sigma
LASFFRYYAYELDYKRYVVSLHSTASRGIVEREVKAELEGWRNYSAALTIEVSSLKFNESIRLNRVATRC